jgi:hypothetical protein
LIIEDILLKDKRDSTLFEAARMGAFLKKLNLKQHEVSLGKVFIDNGQFQLLTHAGDSSLNIQFLIDFFSSSDSVAAPDTAGGVPWKLYCSQVDLNSFRFHYQDANRTPVPWGMDYTNIDVADIRLTMQEIRIQGDTIRAYIKNLSAAERSGFTLHRMNGFVRVSSSFIRADLLKIETDHSRLDLDFGFRYKEFRAFNDFLNKVTIDARIRRSDFDMTDIGYFAPDIAEMKNRFVISGNLNGTVSKFLARNFRVSFGEASMFSGDIYAVGLPDIYSTYVDMNILSLETSKNDIEAFRLPSDSMKIVLPDIIQTLGHMELNGKYTGFYNNFVADGMLRTDIGSVKTNMRLKTQGKSTPVAYNGSIGLTGFDIGKITGSPDMFGVATLQGTIDGSGFSSYDADLLMRIHIDSAEVNNYMYTDVEVNGSV